MVVIHDRWMNTYLLGRSFKYKTLTTTSRKHQLNVAGRKNPLLLHSSCLLLPLASFARGFIVHCKIYIASESKLSSIFELYMLEGQMLAGSMVNTVGTDLSVSQLANLSMCAKGSEFASIIKGMNFKPFSYFNTFKYKRMSGESRLLVWASAKAEEIEVEAKENAKLLRV